MHILIHPFLAVLLPVAVFALLTFVTDRFSSSEWRKVVATHTLATAGTMLVLALVFLGSEQVMSKLVMGIGACLIANAISLAGATLSERLFVPGIVIGFCIFGSAIISFFFRL